MNDWDVRPDSGKQADMTETELDIQRAKRRAATEDMQPGALIASGDIGGILAGLALFVTKVPGFLFRLLPFGGGWRRRLVSRLSAEWGSPFATPGHSLVWQKLERRTSQQTGGEVSYRLRVTGFLSGQVYWLVCRGADNRVKLSNPCYVDAGLLWRMPDQQVELELAFRNMDLGETIEFALVSPDLNARAFTTLVPFPMEAMEAMGAGDAHISVRLVDSKVQGFEIIATGFEPGEELEFSSKSEEEQVGFVGHADASGAFETMIFPRVLFKSGGTATVSVVGGNASVSIRFPWGKP